MYKYKMTKELRGQIYLRLNHMVTDLELWTECDKNRKSNIIVRPNKAREDETNRQKNG